jgi:hypothetical protein
MRPLTSSISRLELSHLLDVPPELVDALLDSGRVLCHVKRGEPYVPLEQLESFFRDALLRLYRAEATEGIGREAAVVEHREEAWAAPPIPRELAAPPEETSVAEEDEETGADTVLASPAAQPARAAAKPMPVAPPALPQRELPELRGTGRYIPLRRLAGIFGETKFTIVQISSTGLRIRHDEPLMPGDEAKLSFALLMPARSVVVRARVVWTSLAHAGEERFSISGLRVIEHADRLAQAVESLKAAHELQPERRSQTRRSSDGLTVVNDISDEEMALVTAAVERFTNDPVEANRWYSRGRFALSDENVRRAVPERPRDREQVLGIWEYLDRQVDIGKIAGVVHWMRS